MALEVMLRVYFMQQWFGSSDEGIEDALYGIESMRQFADLELHEAAIPDATTVLKFCRRLEMHELTAAMLHAINALLAERGVLLKSRTMVDTTFIHASPSIRPRRGHITRRHVKRRRSSVLL